MCAYDTDLANFGYDTGGKVLSFYFAVVTGWETENKYRVRNTLGQQVYFAAERKKLLVCTFMNIINATPIVPVYR